MYWRPSLNAWNFVKSIASSVKRIESANIVKNLNQRRVTSFWVKCIFRIQWSDFASLDFDINTAHLPKSCKGGSTADQKDFVSARFIQLATNFIFAYRSRLGPGKIQLLTNKQVEMLTFYKAANENKLSNYQIELLLIEIS